VAEVAVPPIGAMVRGRPRTAGRAWGWWVAAVTTAAVAAAVVLAPSAHRASPGAPLAWLLFVTAPVHVAATFCLFSLRDVRRYAGAHKGRFLLAPLLAITGGMALAAALPEGLLAWVLLVFFAWQFHHYQRQNVGMVCLAASGGLRGPTRSERRCIVATGACGVAGLVSRPALLQLDVRPPWAGCFGLACAAFVLAAGLGVLAVAARPAGERPGGYCAAAAAALLFPLPIFVFGQPYQAVAGLTIAHGFQYLMLVGLVAAGTRRRARDEVAVLAVAALAGGAALSALSHTHASASGLRVLFGLYLGVVATHFVVDAGLWRLRDPDVRAFLSARLPALVPCGPSSCIGRLPIDRRPI
jgi:hypothetical protein